MLRVHQPFVSRQRLLAVQEVRRRLAGRGLVIPVPIRRHNALVFRYGNRWAELEEYIPHERAEPAPGSYCWLFGALGILHRALAGLELTVPRPLVATYAPPGSLRHWLPVTESAVQGDPGASNSVHSLTMTLAESGLVCHTAPERRVAVWHGNTHRSISVMIQNSSNSLRK